MKLFNLYIDYTSVMLADETKIQNSYSLSIHMNFKTTEPVVVNDLFLHEYFFNRTQFVLQLLFQS